MPFQTEYFFEFENQSYIVRVDNSLEAQDKEEVLEISNKGRPKEQFTISTFQINGQELEAIKILELPELFRKHLSDAITDELNNSFFANPYFDTLLVFHPLEVITSKDQYKQIKCDQCTKQDLYEKKKYKLNKSSYIDKVKKILTVRPNTDWPYKKGLLVQCSVSNKESALKHIDVDNLSKTILDSFKGTVYNDDSQVVALACNKSSVLGQKALIVAVRELAINEKPIFQEFLYSGNSATWLEQERKKSESGKMTYFRLIGNIDIAQ